MNLLPAPTRLEASSINAFSKSQDWEDVMGYLLRAQAVTQMLGSDTTGNETGLAKMLELAGKKASSAKMEFTSSQIDLAAIKTPLIPFRSAAADVSELKDNLSLVRVIRPAALQVKVAAADALAKLIVLGEKAVAISADATNPPPISLKGLLDALGNSCAKAVSGPPGCPCSKVRDLV